MLLPLKTIPELRDLPVADRRRVWHQALRDPFRLTDVVRVAVLLLAAGVAGIAIAWLSIERWWAIPAHFAIFLAFLFFMDAVMVQRYRPVIRRLRETGTA